MHKKNTNDNSEEKDIAALSDMALRHYQDGDLQQAQDDCQRILREQQRPDAILILAKIAHERSEFKVAAERYQQFLEIIPNHEQTHFNLGAVLEQLGRIEHAIEHYKKAITITADNVAVHSRLADACCKLERWEEAIRSYRQVLALQPAHAATIIKLGDALIGAQLFTESILLYEQALTILPDNALVRRQLGISLQKMGQMKRAIKCFEQALRLRPDDVELRIDLTRALRHLGRAEEALVLIEQVIGDQPEESKIHIELALTLRQLGETDLAVERLAQFLRARPTCGEAYYNISLIKPESALIPAVEKIICQHDLSKSDAMYCHFALGNFFDSCKFFDQAFEHFLSANRLVRQTFTYDAKETSQTVDNLIEIYCKDSIQSKSQWGSASQLPVFIVGMPRSGTTLVEQILSSHALVHGAGELDAFRGVTRTIAERINSVEPLAEGMAHIDAKMVEEYCAQYLQELTLQDPAAKRITDKQPTNFVRIGLIKTLFPDARIIHCQRNPLDNCISLFFSFFSNFKCSFELTELGQYYLDYQRLMSHWQKLFADEIFAVRYEELVVDQERVSKRLIDYLGLQWDEKCLDFHNNERNITSPSNTQVRQPMYQKSIDRWKPYEKQLQPLIEVLQQGN